MIDGYAHCGLSKYLPVDDVLATMQAADVDRAVLCQHLGEYDNGYLAEVVAAHPDKFAAICLVDPTSRSAECDLEKWSATGRFRGVRLLTDWLRDFPALWDRAVALDLTLVLYAPQGIAEAIPSIVPFLAEHPKARLVVTHLGNPPIKDGRPADQALLQLASEPTVFVQLSGLSQFCEYPHIELYDLICETIREFGAPRIYWGSNYPVCGDAATYRRDLRHVLDGAWGLTGDQIESMTHRTAESLWFPK